MEEIKSRDNSFDYYKDIYEMAKKFSLLSKIGLAGGIITLSPNITLFALLFTVLLKNTRNGVLTDLADCDEYQRFNQIYEFVLSEMVKNIKEYNFSSIEEIYAYYIYCIFKKYLCYDKNIGCINDQVIYVESAILKPLILNNHGQCRNLSPVLGDLMEAFGYEEANIGCYRLKGNTFSKDVDYNQEKVSQMSTQEAFKYVGEKEIEQLIKQYKEKYPKKPKFTETHVISQVNDANYTYYLDLAIPQIYVPVLERSGECVSPMGDFIIFDLNKKNKSIFKDRLVEKEFKNPFDVIWNFAQVEDIIDNNKDVLEKLHREIRPALEEAEGIYQKIYIPKKGDK